MKRIKRDLLVVISFLYLMDLGSASAETAWITESIDSPHYITLVDERSLCIDSTERPHLAYGGRDGFYYAWFDDEGWRIERVSQTYGEYVTTSLVLSPEDAPRIVFSGNDDQINGRYVGYASLNISDWDLAIIDSGQDTGEFPRFALDGIGRSHVVYRAGEWAPGSLRYALYDDGEWMVEVIDVPGTPAPGFSVALDSYSDPRISYSDIDTGRLMYAYYDGIVWDGMTVDDQGWAGMYTSIVVDEQNVPHIAYYDERTKDLKYACFAGIEWQIDLVDSLGTVGQYPSLALDGTGHPHISYQDTDTPALKYATKMGGIWEIETIGQQVWPVGTSIAIDDAGDVCVGYFDIESVHLYYARRYDETWSIATVDRAGMITDDLSLTVDAQGDPVVAYHDNLSLDLRCARRNRDGWSIEVVDGEGNVGQDPGIGSDPEGHIHISYYDLENADLKYSRWDEEGWSVELVDDVGNVGRYTSLVVDVEGNPRISYYDATNNSLKYAQRNEGDWEIEATGSVGGRFTSICLDPEGMPHISHYDVSQEDLKYSFRGVEGWETESVDKPGNVGICTSIVVDDTGIPHISYLELIPNSCPILARVKYAYQEDVEWRIETVEQSVGYSSTSIRLDPSGYACISFAGIEGGLMFARRGADGWRIQCADSSEGSGYCPNQGFDSNGIVHIVHVDRSGYDLLYTYSLGAGGEFPEPIPRTRECISVLPNPVKNHALIFYDGGRETGRITLGIYDLMGRLVDIPVLHRHRNDERIFEWNVKENGIRSGVYVVRTRSGYQKNVDQKKIVVIP